MQGNYLGQAPIDAELRRDSTQALKFSKPGYEDTFVTVKHSPDTPWFFWDIGTCVFPITLCIPLLVDAVSGSWYSLEDNYAAKLPEKAPAQTVAPPPVAPPTAVPDPYGD